MFEFWRDFSKTSRLGTLGYTQGIPFYVASYMRHTALFANRPQPDLECSRGRADLLLCGRGNLDRRSQHSPGCWNVSFTTKYNIIQQNKASHRFWHVRHVRRIALIPCLLPIKIKLPGRAYGLHHFCGASQRGGGAVCFAC